MIFIGNPLFFHAQKTSVPSINFDPFFHRLPRNEQEEYVQLYQFFAVAEDRNKKFLGLSTFIKHLTMVHDFIKRNNERDGIRGILCGIHFTDDAFLINTSKLKVLMNRSKSCLNSCFKRMGFVNVKPIRDIVTILAEIYPAATTIFSSTSRQWCVRKITSNSPLKLSSTILTQLIQKEPQKEMFFADLNTLLKK
ncbi:hypothetical protein TRFO_42838 [Tritrichomonas foetus]|uniref:Initiator binding domain-containing protein n=1 Tax=Tritrichomonas foetus TaxID=1144522 RepID=A0A1J4KYU2_9EUKA|nr:hypothetical protein TRFO_42838 [Tritrichomonas foetus]|eukprot:OHT14878.1 hypothetical protein TRFO_42838 [Tritrichomonas foetus]